MQQCQQTQNQSVYQHGLSVKEHIFQLIDYLETGELIGEWRMPSWLKEYQIGRAHV